jgi:hypothetical protein
LVFVIAGSMNLCFVGKKVSKFKFLTFENKNITFENKNLTFGIENLPFEIENFYFRTILSFAT